MPKILLFDEKNHLLLNKDNDFLDYLDFLKAFNKSKLESVNKDNLVEYQDANNNKYYSGILSKEIIQEIARINNEGWILASVKKYLLDSSLSKIEIITTLRQLAFWNYNHQFCGRCGTETIRKYDEYVKQCASCDYQVYPRITPCVLAAVIKDDKILLGRAPHFPPGVYSLLAGFVEVGETCEQAVIREVHEESGIEVHNVNYFGSQPWPFPHSLMLAYTAEYLRGEIIVEYDELEDVRWFSFEGLRTCPDLLPAKPSLSRMLIDSLIKEFSISQ